MARKSKKKERIKIFGELKEETKHSVLAVIFFMLSAFFVFAAWQKSGLVGDFIFNILDYLVGIGFFILPLLMFMLGISFFRSTRPELALTKTIGSVLFFVSGLGIISLLFKNGSGGIIGKAISSSLITLFDTYISMVFLAALLIISVLLIMDTKLSMKMPSFVLFKKKESDEEEEEYEEDDEEYEDEEEEYEEEEEYDEEDDGEEDEDEKKGFNIMGIGKKKSGKGSVESEEVMDLVNPVKHRVYTPPPLSLLSNDKGKPDVGDIKANANIIKRTLQNFGITVEMDEISVGPAVTRYALKPAEGVKLSRIVGLQNDLGLALAAHPIRIEAPIPGKSLVGIEVPNHARTTVGLGNLLGSKEFSSFTKPITFAVGKGVSGKAFFASLAKLPHVLIAGATGSGKSVTIHTLINSLLYRSSPEHLRFIMVDPKRVELTLYKGIPHLLTPVITDAKKAILALKWAAKEMDRRYDVLESESVRDIASYHKNIVAPAYEGYDESDGDEENSAGLPEQMPYIVVVIDELADIMQAYPRELESAIVRLAQMSRAVGIHLVLSTQRPSVNVITGLIKANIPGRVALQVASQIDSRTILDGSGAEKLLGAGDMLYLSGEMSQPQRVQSAFISEEEVKKIVKFLTKQYKDEVPDEINFAAAEKDSMFDAMNGDKFGDEEDDELYEEARETVIEAGKASTSYLQRKLRIGYARAARLMDILEERGVIGPADGSKPREILADDDEEYEEGVEEDDDEEYEDGDEEEYDDEDEEDEEDDKEKK
ncbi:DNA translocase FtsK 4TM domain-containing protein [Patescibacteria group bacterium]